MKKFLLAAAAVAMPMGMLVATAGAASAHGVSKVNVSKDSISCAVAATAALAPKVTTTPPAKVNSTIHVTLSGCTVTGANAAAFTGVTVTGSGTGVLHATTTGLTGLPATAPTAGKITVTWRAGSVHLSAPQSKVTIGSVTAAAAVDGNVALSIGSTSVKGDFGGADNGASSSLAAETTQSLADLATALTTTGLSSVAFGGTVSLG